MKLAVFLMSLLLVMTCRANEALDALQDIAKAREARASNYVKNNNKAEAFSKDHYFVFIYKRPARIARTSHLL